jgi:hypothetical protein
MQFFHVIQDEQKKLEHILGSVHTAPTYRKRYNLTNVHHSSAVVSRELYNLTNVHHSSAVVYRQLSQHESKFSAFYRMNPENFHFLKKPSDTISSRFTDELSLN